MGVHDKTRLLVDGLPYGVRFSSFDGASCVLFQDLPYELEAIAFSWIAALSPDCQRKLLLVREASAIGISCDGWAAFVEWIVHVLREELQRPGAGERAIALLSSNSRANE